MNTIATSNRVGRCAARYSLRWRATAAVAAALALALVAAAPARAADVLVFAAASTTNAVAEIAELANRRGLPRIVPAFASSSALARQIVNGAPADIYVSANVKWMDHVDKTGAIDRKSRINLVGNALVLIAPKGGRLSALPAPAIVTGDYPLAARLGDGRLAIGDPAHVPAGIYGKEALVSLGLWRPLENRLAPTANVRAALALVERGEAEAGIVYATDAAVVADKVLVVGTFPARSHAPIIYPAAILAGRGSDDVRQVFAFLTSAEAAAVYSRHGFTPLAAAPQDGNQPGRRKRSGTKKRK